jgi:hypothetical protein
LYENKPRKAIIVSVSEKPTNRKQKERKTKENTGIVLSPSFVWWVVENVRGKRRNLGWFG